MKKSTGTNIKVSACNGKTTVVVGVNTIALPAPEPRDGIGYFLVIGFEQVVKTGITLSAMAVRNGANSADLATFDNIIMGPTTDDADTVLMLSIDDYLAAGAGSAGTFRFLYTPTAAPDSACAMIISMPRRQPAGNIDDNGNTYYPEEA